MGKEGLPYRHKQAGNQELLKPFFYIRFVANYPKIAFGKF